MIPILQNHDHTKVIGTIEAKCCRLCFRFKIPISRDEMFQVFGNTGISITEAELRDGETYVTAGEIMEFSTEAVTVDSSP
jgi:hypothetical protein